MSEALLLAHQRLLARQFLVVVAVSACEVLLVLCTWLGGGAVVVGLRLDVVSLAVLDGVRLEGTSSPCDSHALELIGRGLDHRFAT